MNEQTVPLEIAPLSARGELRGFVLVGRWPDSTLEWLRVLTLTVRLAAVPGMLSTTTIFRAREEVPYDPPAEAVGMVLAEGRVAGARALTPGQLADPLPPALMVLHPPSETRPSLPEVDGVASGCVLLPGLPHLGLDHRAGWVAANQEGVVTSMASRSEVELAGDPDTAVLGMLIGA